MNKQELRSMLQDFGQALAENKLPLTFFVGGDVEFGRLDILNQTEPGKLLKGILEKETATVLNVDLEYVDELLITYYLMMNTSVLIEHTGHSVSTGVYQPSIDRGVFTLDEEEIKTMYKLHGVDNIPDKAWKDLNNAISGISANYNISKIKALRLDWGKCKTTNPRSLMSYDDGIHIIPTDVIAGYQSKLLEMSLSGAYKITYKRVNTADRVQYVTLNRDIINDIYKDDLKFANTFHEVSTPKSFNYHGKQVYTSTLNGFWAVGDLGLSRFVFNPKRHLSLSRITEIKEVNESDVKEIRKYVNVDLESVVDLFMHYLSKLDATQRGRVAKDIGCENPNLAEYVQAQVTIFSTTYLKYLHDYMMTNQEIFEGYTGIKQNNFENPHSLSGSNIQFGSTENIDF